MPLVSVGLYHNTGSKNTSLRIETEEPLAEKYQIHPSGGSFLLRPSPAGFSCRRRKNYFVIGVPVAHLIKIGLDLFGKTDCQMYPGDMSIVIPEERKRSRGNKSILSVSLDVVLDPHESMRKAQDLVNQIAENYGYDLEIVDNKVRAFKITKEYV